LRSVRLLTTLCVVLPLAWLTPAFAQPAGTTASEIDPEAGYEGPPAPVLPATMARDAQGRTTVRAVRVPVPLQLDGALDEDFYHSFQPMSDLIQVEPTAGAAATEKTEVWVSFDDDNVYVSMRAFESQPARMVVNEMRRDSFQIFQNENLAFSFDTFYDRRNSVSFQFNPLGGRMDGQITNEGQFAADWNPVWQLEIRRTPDGWTAEAAVPFKSLRYTPGRAQVWGFQVRRINRWKNETSYLTRLPANNGMQRVSDYATMIGIEAPSSARPLDIKPYVTSNVTSDLTADPRVHGRVGKDFGVDAKYGVTRGLVGDFTYNTDFAQVEADEQQVNLTRFSLFFPEKRDFFLENAGIFSFGGANNNGDSPILFYSRRIGLDRGVAVPIKAGGRLTGRAGPYSIGLLDMQTDGVDSRGVRSANFAVARVRRDVLRRSAIGVLASRQSTIGGGAGAGETFGVDGMFAFFTNVTIQTFWAKAQSPGVTAGDTSHRVQFTANGDRYGLQGERLFVGDHFRPEAGFVRRDDFTKTRLQGRFSPRPTRITGVRKVTYQSSAEYFENGAGQKETRELIGDVQVEFQSSDDIRFRVQDNFELLVAPFEIARGVVVPAGGYTLRTYRGQINVGEQRRASGTLFVERGPFWGGERTGLGVSSARVKVNPYLAIEPGLTVNRVTLPYGSFTATLLSARTTYTVTPMMFVSSLVQYNSSNRSLGVNLRFRWEYQPGSEVFVVFNEGRDTTRHGAPDLQNRSVVVKVNRLFRF
jgi:hypothetical protein